MDNKKIGYFIAECRKEKQITQQYLAERLNITNKAVSKWETGNGFPDISLLPELANILSVSVDEILRAKRDDKDIATLANMDTTTTNERKVIHDSDYVMNYLVNKSIAKFKMMSLLSVILSAVGIIIQFIIWQETNNLTGWLFGCWLGLCGGGVFYYFRTLMKNQILNYNKAADNEIYESEISNPYFKSLKILWTIMIITLIFYVF